MPISSPFLTMKRGRILVGSQPQMGLEASGLKGLLGNDKRTSSLQRCKMKNIKTTSRKVCGEAVILYFAKYKSTLQSTFPQVPSGLP